MLLDPRGWLEKARESWNGQPWQEGERAVMGGELPERIKASLAQCSI